MKVLVTGGAGFIASHIVDAYLERGCDVTVLDNLSTGSRQNVDSRAKLVVADLNDDATVQLVRNGGFDLVNHHAAQIDVRVSVKDPALDAQTNVVGSLKLIQAALESGVKKIVFASSGGAGYGEPELYPQTEEHSTRPISPYGCAKIAIEQYLFYYKVVHGLPSAWMRYGNVYGPRQRKDGEAGVIAIFAGKLLTGETAVINGDGEQTRDYVYVGDVVRANMAVSESELEGAFNVGTGIETSVNDLWAGIQKAAGRVGHAQHAPAKAGEQQRSVLDGSKLRKAAKLPEPESLEAGLRKTVEWLRTR